jgi:glutathione S-transferase
LPFRDTSAPEGAHNTTAGLSTVDKVKSTLDHLEKSAAQFGDRVDIGTITTACGLGYLDFRFPDLGWRTSRPQLSRWFTEFGKRPAMQATSAPA